MAISKDKLYSFIDSQEFQRRLEQALKEAGILTIAVLADDDRVHRAAVLIYDNLPAYIRVGLSATIGKDGFVGFVFRLRDRLMEQERLDLSWLDLGQIKVLLAHVDTQSFANCLWVFTGRTSEGRTIIFDFPGPGKESEKALFRPSFFVGRSADECHIVVPDPRISRKHAELTYFADKGLCIRDLQSTNGTYLNGARVQHAYETLQSGSEIALGELTMRVSILW